MVYVPKYEQSPEGRVLRQLRHAADLTQREIGEMVNVSHGYYGGVELGVWRAPEYLIRAFCAALNLPRSMEQRLLALRRTEWKQPVKPKTPRIKRVKKVDQSTRDLIPVRPRKVARSIDG